jgi:hypothetical protein
MVQKRIFSQFIGRYGRFDLATRLVICNFYSLIQFCSRPVTLRGNLENLGDQGEEVVENYKVVKRLIGHQSGNFGWGKRFFRLFE